MFQDDSNNHYNVNDEEFSVMVNELLSSVTLGCGNVIVLLLFIIYYRLNEGRGKKHCARPTTNRKQEDRQFSKSLL